MTEFVIGDTHFGHANILKFCPTRAALWKNVTEMNEGLVERWNETVRPCDVVYHLGDFYLGHPINLNWARQLNGKIRLMFGNHEHGKVQRYVDMFDAILPQPYPWAGKLVLSHAPLHPSCLSRRGWAINVHGHIHERVVEKSGVADSRYFNASVEQIDFRPFPLLEVLDRLKKVEISLNETWR